MTEYLLKSAYKWLLVVLLCFSVFLIMFSLSAYVYQQKYKNKIYPGVKIGSLNLGGKTLSEAEQILEKRVEEVKNDEIIFFYEDIKIPILPAISSAPDTGLSKEIINYNVNAMAKNAYSIGRRGINIGHNFLEQLVLISSGRKLLPIYNLNEEEIITILKDNFVLKEVRAKDAKLKINDDFIIEIEKEEAGYTLDFDDALLTLIKELDKFETRSINISLQKTVEMPKIKKDNVEGADDQARILLNMAPFKLKFDDQEWLIEKKIFKDWITLKNAPSFVNANESSTSTTSLEKFKYLTLEKKEVTKYLEKIAQEINIIPLNARFEIKDGKVVEFQSSKDGLELDIEKSYEYLCEKILHFEEKEITLAVKEIKAVVNVDNINEIGIKKIIGTGKSNFKGSPRNRRQNIKTGAEALNGILISPDEDFSLVQALGEIGAENGYLPELVIKGNKTIPEYGGGLCQIGTTLFRAALDSGLPITERRNHSYRVSYYEPAGTDATIYNPKPDMKFLNDTGHHILIQTRIEKDELIFEFWGTQDGRIVEKIEPKIYNIVKPGPTKLIETEDLEPGKKKCTESSHNGADAVFHYKVTYKDGSIKERDFESHYTPWQAVCLIGKAKSTNTDTASSTEEKPN